MEKHVSFRRWRIGLDQEKTNLGKENTEKRITKQKIIWGRLIDLVKDEIRLDDLNRILDVGGERTSIFLSLRNGEKTAVDPLFDQIFLSEPDLKGIDEYKDVNFISCSIEELASEKQYDTIFMLMVLNHLGELNEIPEKIDSLLAPSGTLIIVVECYADPVVRNIMKFFDVLSYHPHHFLVNDVINIFPRYKLLKKQQIWQIYSDFPLENSNNKKIRFYRIDLIAARVWNFSAQFGKRNPIFVAKVTLCFALAFTTAFLRHREDPVRPIDKPWLFVFKNL